MADFCSCSQGTFMKATVLLRRNEFWDSITVSSGFQLSDPARLTFFGEQPLPPALPAVQAPAGVLRVLFELHGHSGGEAAVSARLAPVPSRRPPRPRRGCGSPGTAAPRAGQPLHHSPERPPPHPPWLPGGPEQLPRPGPAPRPRRAAPGGMGRVGGAAGPACGEGTAGLPWRGCGDPPQSWV